jgi:rSAM/selenodomain-associated transferase 1
MRRHPRFRRRGEPSAPSKPAAPFRWRLVVMAKAPVAGRVKTRIAGQAGVAAAARFARLGAAALLRRVAADPRWSTTVAVTPDAAALRRLWPGGAALAPQGDGDLGRRMQRIFERAPHGPVVIVGTDVPGITPGLIAAAFRLLGRHDAVFGPAADGGYWLVGMRRRPRVLQPFHGVRWSTAHALDDTLANLSGRSVARVATLSDVDTAADLARCAGVFARRIRQRT